MKNLYIFLLLLIGVVGFGQNTKEIDSIKTNTLFDHYGNKYNPADIKINKNVNSANNRGALLCSTSMFNLYFDAGSGMEILGNTTHDARREVVCQVFQDLTNFINSPLKNPSNTAKVNIWIRNINNVTGFPTPAETSNVLGLASSFYSIAGSPYNFTGPIADGEIWKTINSGRDSYTSTLYLASPEIDGSILESGFYHGMMAFNFDNLSNNWHTNLGTNAPLDSLDLYSVVLHEVTHALGFVSLINHDGTSKLTGKRAYSRYDRFLKDTNDNFLIDDNDHSCSMYNYKFNINSNVNSLHPGCGLPNGVFNGNTDHTICGNAIQYVGRSTVPVYTPVCYENGSSLSHFEDEVYPTCNPANNNNYFVMSNAIGSASTKRFLKTEERNVLLDIGYSVNMTYGNAAQNSYIDYNSTFVNNNIVAGINDGLNSVNQTFDFSGDLNQNILITGILLNDFTNLNSSDFNTNDIQNLRFECLEELVNYNYNNLNDYVGTAGVLSTTSGDSNTNITYQSNSPGMHLLRYVPYNFITQQRGNLTYIYVHVNDNTNCAIVPPNNNLVYNGDFEQYSLVPSNLSQINRACGWKQVGFASPDYFHNQAPISRVDIPCNELGYQDVKNGIGNSYAGMMNISEYYTFYYGGLLPYDETISTKLVTSLLPNTTYQLCFDVSLAEGASLFAMKFQAYLSQSEIPATYSVGNIPITNPSMLFTNSSFSTTADDGSDLTNGWERVSFTFTTGAISGEQYLYIGGLKDVQYIQRTPGASLPGCSNVNYNVSGPNFNKAAYYYVDNVSLIPYTQPILNLPNQVCSTTIISNLNNYLVPAMSDGTFSGQGVVNNGGVYSFDATIAGIGSHTISYSNNSGCGTLVSDVITVVNATGVIPEFDGYGIICSGETLPPLPTTSNNGITGLWDLELSNTITQTYTFTPTDGQCATPYTMTIIVDPKVVPTFTPIVPICFEGVLNPLPTTSNNGITGTWLTALNNTATTTYTFAPSIGFCATNATITIEVLLENDPACNNSCVGDLTLSDPEFATPVTHQVQDWILTNDTYTVSSGQDVNMTAGNFIHLKPNSHIKSGSVFLAKIQSCVTAKIAVQEAEYIQNNGVVVYPNPTNELVTISSENAMIRSMIISSMEGKTVYESNIINAKSHQLNISNYKVGMYMLVVKTADGKITYQKLIKN
ncbi:Por secretion system C-terminal sorting domain-containing protein [Flavobacterium swingsii]|uniref:Por secretion system C-terminal sorting domain-containing protein n=1 Tax=Flavobacterium swingsii TaxID=498292 RepID=A0A1I0Y9H2_9FLAO|nr:T9SS type A sorting domain-containing protein [Flavobacterium swingsii]SFB09416.1 Por secretion system C-terminal sorting domain-containing protein [Flavobacterium swingsii]